MTADRTPEDPRLISPELVLVSSPEDTKDARAQLAQSPWATPAAEPERTVAGTSNRRKLRIGAAVALLVVGLGVASYVAANHWRDHPTKTAASTFVPSRTWAWAPATGADGYEVTFFRGQQVVFRARTTEPRVAMPQSFRFQAGTYRWTVRALPAAAGAAPIVDSSFTLTSAGAAAANSAG